MSAITCFSSFTWSYLARARVMSASLRAAHPDWHQVALVVDASAEGAAEALAPFDEVIHAADLGIPDFPAFLFRHTLVEACTALKPRLFARLFARGVEAVVYLDPDIAVFHPLRSVTEALDRASIILTPHQHTPNTEPQAFQDAERTAQLYGVFNLGFAAARRDEAGHAFIAWWQERCETDCRDAPEEGRFTDQRYCDLVPALFDGVAILRDPGCNVASWNLSRRRPVVTQAGNIEVDGHPLAFYHFTKIGGVGDIMTQRYAADEVPLEICHWWQRRVAEEANPALDSRPWAWASFADATPIPTALRRLWREDASLHTRFADPFAAGPGTLLAWARAEHPALFAAA